VRALSLVCFSNKISLSSPCINGIFVSFFFPQCLRSAQMPEPIRMRTSRETYNRKPISDLPALLTVFPRLKLVCVIAENLHFHKGTINPEKTTFLCLYCVRKF